MKKFSAYSSSDSNDYKTNYLRKKRKLNDSTDGDYNSFSEELSSGEVYAIQQAYTRKLRPRNNNKIIQQTNINNEQINEKIQQQKKEKMQQQKPKNQEFKGKSNSSTEEDQQQQNLNFINENNEDDDLSNEDDQNQLSETDDDENSDDKNQLFNKRTIKNYMNCSNENICFICRKGNMLLSCSICTKAFHLDCIKQENLSLMKNQTPCPFCSQINNDFCNFCSQTLNNDQDFQVKCSLCYKVVHYNCIKVPLVLMLDSPMNIKFTINPAVQIAIEAFKRNQTLQRKQQIFEEYKSLVEKRRQQNDVSIIYHICNLCRKYNGYEKIYTTFKIANEIYYLVKPIFASFLHSNWLNEQQVGEINQIKLDHFKLRYKEPNEIQEIINSELQPQPSLQQNGENNEEKLKEESLDSCQIERIIECKKPAQYAQLTFKEIRTEIYKNFQSGFQPKVQFGKQSNFIYLVKWENLEYNRCTWEDEFIVIQYMDKLKSFIQRQILDDTFGSLNFKKEQLLLKRIPENNLNLQNQPAYISGGQLEDFQLYGFKWLVKSYKRGNNVILADEMGLGKTIQTISFLNYLFYEQQINGPFLILAPVSTLYNWLREIDKWGEKFNAIVYYGNQESRQMIKQKEFYYLESSQSCKFNILITNYEMVNSKDINLLKKIYWKTIIVDEAQRLKNNKTLFFNNIKQCISPFKILLTGTPLQNKINELINIFEYICPDKANDIKRLSIFQKFCKSNQLKLKQKNENKISNHKKTKHPQQEIEFTAEDQENLIGYLTMQLGPHLLRRKKKDVMQNLPEIEEIAIKIHLTQKQKYIYKNILQNNLDSLQMFNTDRNQLQIVSVLNMLCNLRLVSNHPYNFLYKSKFYIPEDEAEFRNEIINSSNKLKFLEKVIPKLIKEGHKILIFSQFTIMLDVLCEFFYFMKIPFEKLDGRSKTFERLQSIDRFNEKESKSNIFLLSTRAGGLGINLATADTVIFIDSDFNPFMDNQAISRAHRMGQKNKVFVYRLISKYTVEENIFELSRHKLVLEQYIVNSINQIAKEEQYKLIEKGSYELLKNLEEKDQEFTEEQINLLLDRSGKKDNTLLGQSVTKLDQQSKTISDYYLNSFKISTNEVSLDGKKENWEEENKKFIEQQKYWETLLDKGVEKPNQPNSKQGQQSSGSSEIEEENKDKEKQGKIEIMENRLRIRKAEEIKKSKEEGVKQLMSVFGIKSKEVKPKEPTKKEVKLNIEQLNFNIKKIRYQILSFLLQFGTNLNSFDQLWQDYDERINVFEKDKTLRVNYDDFQKQISEMLDFLLEYFKKSPEEKKQKKYTEFFCGLNIGEISQRILHLCQTRDKYQENERNDDQ